MDQKKNSVYKDSKVICIKLNTKEFCFLCLKQPQNIELNEIDRTYNGLIEHPAVSLLCLRRHLKIDLTNSNSSEVEVPEPEQIEANLCNDCEKVIKRFSVLFQELEKIQMEMNFCLEKIHLRISNGAQDAELVQSYSKRMTSDLQRLSQLAGIDKLRKEISKKCLKTRICRYPTVKMPRVLFDDLSTSSRSLLVKQEPSHSEVEVDFSTPVSPCPSSSHGTVDNPNSDLLEGTEIGPVRKKIKNECMDDPNINLLKSSKVEPERSQSQMGKVFTRDPTTRRFPCPSCEKTFLQSNNARSHYEAVHLKKRWKCDICNHSAFSRYHHLVSHKKVCQQNLKKRSAEEQFRSHYKFPCPTCGKRFPVLYELRRHQKFVHAEPKSFSCDRCNKTFKAAGYLKDHFEAVHLNRTWTCKYCNKKFPYRTTCNRHQKSCPQKGSIKLEENPSQTQRRNFPMDFETGKVLCPLCNEAFAKPDAAHRHYDKVHLQRKYKCSICNVAEYESKNKLFKHKKVCRQVVSQGQ